MQTRKMLSRGLAFLLLTAAIVGTAAIWNATHVRAFNPQPDPPAFGMLAVTHGQTARLNVVDTMDASTGTCMEVELMFLDSMGNVRQHSVQCIAAGHAAFLDINGNFLETVDNRIELRGKVHILNPPERNGINLVETIEVFDNETGRTSFVLAPPPDPDRK